MSGLVAVLKVSLKPWQSSGFSLIARAELSYMVYLAVALRTLLPSTVEIGAAAARCRTCQNLDSNWTVKRICIACFIMLQSS